MCPEMADETNPGEEASPTGRAEVVRGCASGAGGSGFACCTFLLRLTGSAFFCCVGSFGDEVAPGGPVGGKRLPGLGVDVEVF